MFFTNESVNKLAETVKQFYPAFDKEKFVSLIFCIAWEDKELKERMRHTTICLHDTLPPSYPEALEILKKAAPQTKGFEAMCLPDYVELYGMDDWDLSLPALGYFTKFASSEFAIRPFLDKDPQKAIAYMYKWAEDKDL